MQKKHLFLILVALIICIPIARYIDNAPEREKARAERLETERLEEEKKKEEVRQAEVKRKQEEEVRAREEKDMKLQELYMQRSQTLEPLYKIMQEFRSFMMPDPFVRFDISGDFYDNIKISGTHKFIDYDTDDPVTCEFYIKDVTFYSTNDARIEVRCDDGELCIIRNGGRTSTFSNFYLQPSKKLVGLIQSLYAESKRVKPSVIAIQQQIDSIR